MIAHLKGVVLEKNLTDAVIDVQGVGYRVTMSLLSLARLPEAGQAAAVRVRTVAREDALELYGFTSKAEEELFLLLTSVSHVGPKLAINVLSGLEVDALAEAIGKGDVPRLTKIHGVGKKTAERLVLELKDKVKGLAVAESPASATARAPASATVSDLVSALVNLGYTQAQAETAAEACAARVGPDAPFELLFREALRTMRTG